MKDNDPNKDKVENTLNAMISEVKAIETKIQRDMIVPSLAKAGYPDEKDKGQLHGFLRDMTNGIQVNGNKFLDGVYLTEEQKGSLKGKSFEDQNTLRAKFAQSHPEYSAARDKVNQTLSAAISESTTQLDTSITKAPAVKDLIAKASKEAGLEHKSDKIRQALSSPLMQMKLEDLQKPELQGKLAKSLSNAKTLSKTSLGTATIASSSLSKIAERVKSPEKQALTMRDHLVNFASRVGQTMGIISGVKPRSKSDGLQR